MEEIARLHNVRHVYPDGTHVQFSGLDFVVHERERVLLLGANGSGKSTLLFHLLGLLKPSEGTVRVFDRDPGKEYNRVRERIGVVLQDPDQQIIAPTVRDDIGFSPRNYGRSPREVETLVGQAANLLGIAHLLNKVPHYLSGGERTKVALAGALVLRPDLLILDEPFEGLDTAARAELIDLLNHLNQEYGLATIVATHEVNLAPHFVDTVYLIGRGGQLVTRGTPSEILSDIELLAAHHLEPPVLSVLFQELRRRGVQIPTHLTVTDAASALLSEIHGSGGRTDNKNA